MEEKSTIKVNFEVQSVIYPRTKIDFFGGGAINSGFSIVKGVLLDDKIVFPDGKTRYQGETITMKGNGLPSNQAKITAWCNMSYDAKFKTWQLDAKIVNLDVNLEAVENIQKFLSEHISGVSDKTAKLIVDEFGDETLEVLKNDINRLYAIKGIKGKRIEIIKESMGRFTSNEGAAEYLMPIGVPLYAITSINAHFGVERAKEVIQNKPYSLCKVPGIYFPMVHQIVETLGIKGQDEPMYAFAIEHTIKMLETTGSSYYPIKKVVKSVIRLIGNSGKQFDEEMFRKAMNIIAKRGIVVINWKKGNIGLSSLLQKEKEIHDIYMSMLPHRTTSDYSDVVKVVSNKNGINLHYKQADAITILLNHKYGILTGGPGTGKTTVLKCYIECFERQNGGAKVLCLAPTGRAASRMSESTGRPAFTVHKKLGLKPNDVELPEGVEITHDLVVVDESSMLDINIAHALLKSLSPRTRLVLVGDENQLPSVGAGSVLADLIYSGFVGVARLTKTFRQGADSSIVANANMIKDGQAKLITSAEDYKEIPVTYDEKGLQKIVDTYLQAAEVFGENNVVALLPMRKKSSNGTFRIAVETINPIIQEAINPDKGGISRSNFTYTFREGDRVMQMANTDFVSNGDVGIITEMKKDNTGIVYAKIDFGYEGADSVYYATDEEFNQLALGYATTIHKSQGSEYSCVLTPLFVCDGIMLQRNLLYTAVTRAKKKMIVLGEREAIEIAVSQTDAFKRDTLLEDLFQVDRKNKVAETISPFKDKEKK